MNQRMIAMTLALTALASAAACTTAGSSEPQAQSSEELKKLVLFCLQDHEAQIPESVAQSLVKVGGYHGPCDHVENRASLGDGYVQSIMHWNDDNSPRALGIEIDQAAMDSLPTELNDGNTCWDLNGDGITDPNTECASGHERVLFYPKRSDLPFKWIMFNWQPKGHAPVKVFDKPHFDLHFFIQDYISRNFIRTGPCGTFTNCMDYDKAMINIPAPFWPVGYKNLGGVAGRMGNHLVNTDDSIFHGVPFTQAFAFGQYDGKMSYFEPVIAITFLQTKPTEVCDTIPLPPAMQLSGYYPTKYCTRYRADRNDYTMTLEGFEYRTAPTN